MKSLRARLGLGLSLALVCAFGLQWLLVGIGVQRLTEDYVESRLSADIDELLAALDPDREGGPELEREPGERFRSPPYSGLYYQLQVGAVTLRSPSLWDQMLPLQSVPAGESLRARITGPLDRPLLLLSKGFYKRERQVTISVAEDMSAVDAGIRAFKWLYFAVSVIFLAVLVLSQQWIIHRSLAPLISTRVDLEKVGRGDAEMLGEDVPSEIRPLVREINALLAVLARRLSRSRTLVGNLAHGLKTPLSVLLQLVRDPNLDAVPDMRESLREKVTLLSTELERELTRARLAGDARAGQRFVPERDVPALVKTLEQIYMDKELHIRITGIERGNWPMDREDMLELLGNLADNACKWCRQQVTIGFGPALTLRVEDDGPGLAASLLPGTVRGLRQDETVPGHGLGLSIARDIAEHYCAVLRFEESSDLGGLSVTVEFGHVPA